MPIRVSLVNCKLALGLPNEGAGRCLLGEQRENDYILSVDRDARAARITHPVRFPLKNRALFWRQRRTCVNRTFCIASRAALNRKCIKKSSASTACRFRTRPRSISSTDLKHITTKNNYFSRLFNSFNYFRVFRRCYSSFWKPWDFSRHFYSDL